MLLPAPLVIPQKDANIVLEQLQSDELLLDVKRPGEAIVKVRWTPYWFASNACVEPDGDWTRVIADAEGFVRLSHPLLARAAVLARTADCDAELSEPARLFSRAPVRIRCYVQLVRVWRQSGRWLPNGWLDALRQLALFAGAYYVYRLVRGFVDGQAGLAFENARDLVRHRALARPLLRAGAAGVGARARSGCSRSPTGCT